MLWLIKSIKSYVKLPINVGNIVNIDQFENCI